MWATIRAAILSIVQAQATKIQNAYRTDRSRFDGTPAAIITPAESESDYGTTSTDKRVYVFTIRVHVPIPAEGQDNADIVLEGAIDELLTIFSNKTILGAACDWVEPIPSVWGYQDRSDGQYRIAEMKLRCIKYV